MLKGVQYTHCFSHADVAANRDDRDSSFALWSCMKYVAPCRSETTTTSAYSERQPSIKLPTRTKLGFEILISIERELENSTINASPYKHLIRTHRDTPCILQLFQICPNPLCGL